MIRKWNEESLDNRNALLFAMGLNSEDVKRPGIGILNSWNELNPGHYPFKDVIDEIKLEIYKAGGLALELPVTGICDGICSNTPGDRYTLPSRDMVSSEVETLAEINMLEGIVMLASCDKIVPGMLMGALRVNIPAVMFTGGYMDPGSFKGKMITLTHTKQAYAAYIEGSISKDDYKNIVQNACPTPGICPFMGTANSMCATAEILGFSPIGNASVKSQTPKWHEMAKDSAQKIVELVNKEIRPLDLITQENLNNVVRYMMATGGSTNSILHIPVIARQGGFDISIDYFDKISREVPLISSIYPNHPVYTMKEFSEAGGLGAVIKELAFAGKINLDTKGMFGSLADNILKSNNKNKDVIRAVADARNNQGGLAVLSGNIAEESAIVKFSAVDKAAWEFSGPAKVYDSQDDAWQAILKDEIVAGDMKDLKALRECLTWKLLWLLYLEKILVPKSHLSQMVVFLVLQEV
jgi:dihydroxy-acid dehydratase